MIDCIGVTTARRALVFSGLLLAQSGCSAIEQMPHPDEFGARPVQALPGWGKETATGLRNALSAQCDKAKLHRGWQPLCDDLTGHLDARLSSQPAPDIALKQWVAQRFEAWPVIDRRGARAGLLTGYFEPLLTGSMTRESDHQVALYKPPASLSADKPYKNRQQIEAGLAADELAGQELVWIDSAVEAFFLHIQGSGRVMLRDGSILRVGFAAHNGQKYRAIGRDLVAMGALTRSQLSAQAIKHWLRENAEQSQAVMQLNPRYIFFRKLAALPDNAGPPGSLRVPLTGLRSVATDRRYVPAGSLLYLDSRLPVAKPATTQPQRVGLALSQDTGAAITGQVRADLFTGSGEVAGELAGKMRQPLQMWLLWPKGTTPPPQLPVARRLINP